MMFQKPTLSLQAVLFSFLGPNADSKHIYDFCKEQMRSVRNAFSTWFSRALRVCDIRPFADGLVHGHFVTATSQLVSPWRPDFEHAYMWGSSNTWTLAVPFCLVMQTARSQPSHNQPVFVMGTGPQEEFTDNLVTAEAVSPNVTL